MIKIFADLKGETEKSTIIISDLKTPPPLTDRIIRQKINKDIKDVNSTIKEAEIIHSWRNADVRYFQMHMEYSPRQTIYYVTK